MTTFNQETQSFMLELHSMTGGDIALQVSMYDVGAAIGLDKNESSTLGQDLMIDDLVEMKTLSGGIGITQKGLEILSAEGLIAPSVTHAAQLENGPLLTEQDLQTLTELIREIRSISLPEKSDFNHIEEYVIDIKTIEMQLLSPYPKTAIIREVLTSLKGGCEKIGNLETANKISMLIR